MTPTDRRTIRVTLGLTQAELAAMIGASRATIIRAEDDASAPPSRSVDALYRLLDRFGAEAVDVLREASMITADA